MLEGIKMSSKNIGDIIDVTENLEDGLKLEIKNVSKSEKDGEGRDFIIISTVEGKKYRCYSRVIMETLDKVKSKKFDFGKDTLKVQVREVLMDNGNSYMTLTNPK